MWVVDVHHLPPASVPVRDALNGLRDVLIAPGGFFSDNLVALGRNLTFLADPYFMDAFMRAGPDRLDQSMIWRKHTLYWAAQRAMKLPGDFVEAACYKGFTARVICNGIDLAGAGKQFWLYDLFDAPPPEVHSLPGHSVDLHDWVKARFQDEPHVRIIKGRLPESLSMGAPEQISLLHLDMNNAASEAATLEALFDRVVPGGTIILDDFGWAYYHEQAESHLRWFAERGLQILELPTGQGMVIK